MCRKRPRKMQRLSLHFRTLLPATVGLGLPFPLAVTTPTRLPEGSQMLQSRVVASGDGDEGLKQLVKRGFGLVEGVPLRGRPPGAGNRALEGSASCQGFLATGAPRGRLPAFSATSARLSTSSPSPEPTENGSSLSTHSSLIPKTSVWHF